MSFFKTASKPQNVFTLRNIDPEKVFREFSQTKIEAFETKRGRKSKKKKTDGDIIQEKKDGIAVYGSSDQRKHSTTIDEIIRINKDPRRRHFSFLDNNKKTKHCVMTMTSAIGKKIPDKTDNLCFWCKHKFDTSPIGCPVSLREPICDIVSHNAVFDKTVTRTRTLSNHENTYIREHDEIKTLRDCGNDVHIKGNVKEFITDGIFCSFNCIKAFINDNRSDNLYSRSDSLLSLLYKYCTGSYYDGRITPAPDWRLLSGFGGHLTISEFRKSFDTINFVNTNNICIPVSRIFAEEIVF